MLPWWDRLPDDFFRQPDGTVIDHAHPLKVHGSAGLDRVLRSVVSGLVTAALAPTMWRRERLEQEVARLDVYEALARNADAARAFVAPPEVHVQARTPPWLAYRPSGIPCTLLQFESPFASLHPDLGERYSRLARNRIACAQHWSHAGGPRRTLVVIHGYGADSYAFNAQMFSLRWFHRQGYDVLLYTLPFHGARGERGDWFSGLRLFSGGLWQFNEAMAQAVHDLRIFIAHLRRNGVEHVGLTGLSLGGYTAALMAAVDPDLSFCIPNAPVVSPVDLALEWKPSGPLLHAALRRHALSVPALRAKLAFHAPLSYAPRIDPRHVLIIGGAGDRFVPPRQIRLLHAHWPGSRLHWFPGNHLLHLQRADYLRAMHRFMDRCTLPRADLRSHPDEAQREA